jgi:cytochrome c oxidase cbb3-type subunit III
MPRLTAGSVLLLIASAIAVHSQEPSFCSPRRPEQSSKRSIDFQAIQGTNQNPEAVARGGKVFATFCAGCHGTNASGRPGAPDLIRSVIVLDDEKAILVGPVIREGRPDKGMPKLPLTEQQISDVTSWLHAKTYAAGHRSTYTFGNVLTGDARLGKVYFDGAGKCFECHSAEGDLAKIGQKYDPFTLQFTWLHPKERGSARSTPTVTVTLASGQSLSGPLDYIDDFFVSFRGADRFLRSFKRDSVLKVQIHNPLQAHVDQLRLYTDADIHNITAYLSTLR